MFAERLSSPRARASALALAFAVVAGGIAVATVPTLAAAVEPAQGGASAQTSAATIAPDTATVPFSGAGFDPDAVVYVQVTDPSGRTNYSWNSTTYKVGADGTVSGALPVDGTWAIGDYQVTIFQRDDLKASFGFTVAAASTTAATTTSAPTTSAPVTTSAAPTTDAPTTTAPSTSAPVTTAPETTAPETSAPVATTTAPAVPDAKPTVTLGTPTAWAAQGSFTPDEVAASGVGYSLSGFTPGVELLLKLTLPDGSTAEFASNDPIVPDQYGEYSGTITYSGAWPEGPYTVTLTTREGQPMPELVVVGPTEAPSSPVPDASVAPVPVSDAPTSTASGESRAVPTAPIQSASFTFTVGAAAGQPAGTTTAGTGAQQGGSTTGGGLASTGAEGLDSAIGIGLAVLALGGAAVVGGRFLSRRRDS